MNRRTFFPWITGGVSGSFLLGAAGGLGLGSAGTAVGLEASKTWSQKSYSQQGEDLIVASICDFLRLEHPTYLDIGANDPIRINNTYLFYRMGSRGVLVEPNPAYCRKLRAARPGDVVLNVGIGWTAEKAADYYMIGGDPTGDLNTFSKEMAESYAAKTNGKYHLDKVVKMPLVDINRVIADHFQGAPTIISLDTEGLDLSILKSLDFNRHRPSILCVETLVFGSRQVEAEILDLMKSKGYSIRGGTFVNTVFVDDRLLSSRV